MSTSINMLNISNTELETGW